ncbi:hypothetical protein CMI44_02555 [Candidatus Pacearchaeota archaeon]|jgi:hypothetical protein|nr:hypothetical protein [Candidatus Pacearchaeota archaeon]|tara:strand:- start:695 stop:1093 length:399 start_codon:yes stop_codon:yes gene_type:complete
MKNQFLKALSFFAFPIGVFFFSLFIDYAFNAYVLFPWVDIPMHLLGGVSVGYMSVLFLRFFREENLLIIKNKFIFVLIVVFSVSFIAILWEFWEFLTDYFFQVSSQPGLEDTMLDFLMGMLGGFFAGIFSKI